ncbi:MAG: cyclic nucleotide-binding domain-containing protein [Gammaproteobacteria bacterium]|nr:MAG: cyclic nucleotide-binding domain-containing protein [Gammaproteobacteria bacterium]
MRLFQALEDHDYSDIEQWAEVIDLPPGEIVIRENEIGDYLYVVMEGSVEVFIVDDNGKVIVLHELKEGNYFGEQALLPDGSGRRNANVRTNTAARLVRIPKEKFRLILERDQKLGKALKLIGEAQREQIRRYLAA